MRSAAWLKRFIRRPGAVVLRHAAVMGLVGATEVDPQPLVDASKSSDSSIRLAAILALRRHARPEIASFLREDVLYRVAETARAIHD